ncbi:hypothetical protein SAMN04489761_1156 [Tenacibaculum sp. MAR_2009_124]|uniref:hypothetical protein n=1 Tax=Tenacibaculum sp. MAR_2009_124 TaxID=1250059 RepID=UPI000899C3CD|nr:hypothetical protein [Tenacibaculum sp. MAR_2009_124]SEB51549.1 hypothetical protein SAMN04489761_1156 [Tenacibaculum sp. MAR_2009_124]
MDDIIKNITSVAGIIGLILSLFSKYYPELFYLKKDRKVKDLLKIKEIKELLNDDEDTKFNEFLNSEIKENVFTIRTGIKTNFKSIRKLQHLKDELGLNYSWKNIKNSIRFISLKKEKPTIVISIVDAMVYSIFIISSLISIFYCLVAMYHIDKSIPFKFQLTFITIYTISIIAAFFFFRNSINILDAYLIKRRLEVVRNESE